MNNELLNIYMFRTKIFWEWNFPSQKARGRDRMSRKNLNRKHLHTPKTHQHPSDLEKFKFKQVNIFHI